MFADPFISFDASRSPVEINSGRHGATKRPHSFLYKLELLRDIFISPDSFIKLLRLVFIILDQISSIPIQILYLTSPIDLFQSQSI
jgi:hypothetical protein